LIALLGKDAGGLSASTIARLKDAWSVTAHERADKPPPAPAVVRTPRCGPVIPRGRRRAPRRNISVEFSSCPAAPAMRLTRRLMT
jgi:hypothetical protein